MGTNQPLDPKSIVEQLKAPTSIEAASKDQAEGKIGEVVTFDIEAMTPKLEDIFEIVKTNAFGLQFKRSLEYVQGGTNMTLDRMIKALDNVMATAYLDGYVAGLKAMSKVAIEVIDKAAK